MQKYPLYYTHLHRLCQVMRHVYFTPRILMRSSFSSAFAPGALANPTALAVKKHPTIHIEDIAMLSLR
jgi:hypothetical protein